MSPVPSVSFNAFASMGIITFLAARLPAYDAFKTNISGALRAQWPLLFVKAVLRRHEIFVRHAWMMGSEKRGNPDCPRTIFNRCWNVFWHTLGHSKMTFSTIPWHFLEIFSETPDCPLVLEPLNPRLSAECPRTVRELFSIHAELCFDPI